MQPAARRLLAAALTLFAASAAADPKTDPPVPPGKIMGGIPVAVIGAGIDYTRPEIADRLLRDGEGEIVGFDFADSDRRPYSTEADANATAGIVLAEGQTTQIVAVRTGPFDAFSLGRALYYAGRTPAKIILIDAQLMDTRSTQPLLDPRSVIMLGKAARYFRDKLIVLPAGDDDRDLTTAWPEPERDLANVLVVAAGDATGPGAQSNRGEGILDIVTDGRAATKNTAPNSRRAAARVAALAARITAVEPGLAGAGLKARIAGFAVRLTHATDGPTKLGYIDHPGRIFWLE